MKQINLGKLLYPLVSEEDRENGGTGGGIIPTRAPTSAPTSARPTVQSCTSTGCPAGFFCDSGNIIGYGDSPMGGDPWANPIYGCSPRPTTQPTIGIAPTTEPTQRPTTEPTQRPTTEPTQRPTTEPTGRPCGGPYFGRCPPGEACIPITIPGQGIQFICGVAGTTEPTARPTTEPTARPTGGPTSEPTDRPTGGPTSEPTDRPTLRPTQGPTSPPWRSCVDGNLYPPPIPPTYRSGNYTGLGGGICWEPPATVTFEPDLNTAFNFTYYRSSGNYPSAINAKAINPSYTKTYNILFQTNTEITINPLNLIIPPRSSKDFTVYVTPALYEKLGDGDSVMKTNVTITEV